MMVESVVQRVAVYLASESSEGFGKCAVENSAAPGIGSQIAQSRTQRTHELRHHHWGMRRLPSRCSR